MAQALFNKNRANDEAVFHIFFRQAPFNSKFAIAAGISDVLEYVRNFCFDDDSLSYLSSLKSQAGNYIFTKDFIYYLKNLKPILDIYGVKDGDIVFAHEPMLRIEGPLALCMLLESPLLNIINFQTLVATKAARLKKAAQDKKVIDFSLRRAHGFEGALYATKAAFIGGIDATSNIWAARHLDIPLKGSQAHSYVMSFASQSEAFESFAQSFPDGPILLCDTYNSDEGIRDAIKSLKSVNLSHCGIRIDSGDLYELSVKARLMLNEAGLPHCQIVASGDLDEYSIEKLNQAQAPIDIFGVGTHLVCGGESLGGVYKLASICEKEKWRDTYKISNNPQKATWPGRQAFMRFSSDNNYLFDYVFDPLTGPNLKDKEHYEQNLLTNILMRRGDILYKNISLHDIQEHSRENRARLSLALSELNNNGPAYSVIFDKLLHDKKNNNKEYR